MIVRNIQFNIKNDSNISTGLIKEADLSGHLDEETTEDNSKKGNDDNYSLIETDYQLYEALNVLKGLSIDLKKAG